MYSEQFQKSLALVEAARAKNLAMEPTRMTAEQKEAVLSAFHPDYREDQFEALKIGPNAGDRVPHELADMLQAHSRITSDSVDLTKPDTVKNAMKVFAECLDEFEQLLKEI